MRYFEVGEDMGRRIPGRWTLGYIEDEDGNPLPLSYGIPFHGKPLDGGAPDGSESTDYSEAGYSVPVVRAQLAKAIAAAARADVQCIPIKLEGFSGFVVLNVLRVVDCIDVEKSGFRRLSDEEFKEQSEGCPEEYRCPEVYSYGRGGRDGVRVYIDGSRVPDDAHIFRTKGFESKLVVSERIKEVMERSGSIGAKFMLAGERPGERSSGAETSRDSTRTPRSEKPDVKTSTRTALPKKRWSTKTPPRLPKGRAQ